MRFLLLFAFILTASNALAGPADKPVKVYILAGQSNMVGMGQVGDNGSTQFPTYVSDEPNAGEGLTLSTYEGAYHPPTDYDKQPAIATEVARIGYWDHQHYKKLGKPCVRVARGFIRVATPGKYTFETGSTSICEVDGKKVFERTGEETKGTGTPIDLKAGPHPIRITYTDGNSAWSLLAHTRYQTPGALSTVVQKDGKFRFLVDKDGNWVSRDDVWYKGVVTATANKWLAPGCGAREGRLGPELGFGHVMGDFHEEPVLLLKASQGNRSLAWDFLPPGSERHEVGDKVYAGYKDVQQSWKKGEEPKDGGWYAGKEYDGCFGAAKEVLARFDESFPHWKGRGYEIAGFVWFQGHKDTGDQVHAARYEQNLVRLIKALRKDFNAPGAPFVVAVGCGNEGREGTGLTIANAQLAVDGGTGKYPEFKGNVKTAETREFFPKVEDSPKSEGYHYHLNAETYMRIGEAMGKAMVELQKGK